MYSSGSFLNACAQELGPAPADDGSAQNGAISSGIHKHSLSVNLADRSAVAGFFRDTYRAGIGVPDGWNGNVSQCLAGDTTQAYKDATLQRINFFRAMAGLPGDVTLSNTWSLKCQKAALMWSAKGALSHTPDPSWSCYSADGAEAARNSNITFGYEGPTAIDGYMDDAGAGNSAIGHRRWILYPPQKTMGTGSVGGSSGHWPANTLWVLGGAGTRPASPPFVAWPPQGYFPYQLLPGSSKRWSFSIVGADFSKATVSMWHAGTNLPVALEPVTAGFGDNTIVWIPQGIPTGAPRRDDEYRVTISNVLATSAGTYSYRVFVIDPDQPVLTATIIGTTQLALRWPSTAIGYVVEKCSVLSASATWSAVPGLPVLSNGNYTLTIVPTQGDSFYRLRK